MTIQLRTDMKELRGEVTAYLMKPNRSVTLRIPELPPAILAGVVQVVLSSNSQPRRFRPMTKSSIDGPDYGGKSPLPSRLPPAQTYSPQCPCDRTKEISS